MFEVRLLRWKHLPGGNWSQADCTRLGVTVSQSTESFLLTKTPKLSHECQYFTPWNE